MEEINEFEAEESSDEVTKAKTCLISQIFSQLNPFSQFVIEEIVAGETCEQKTWQLHESMFQTAVNPDHLKKTSEQMFAVYKYLGDPKMKIRRSDQDEFIEMKDLVPNCKFFAAPEKVKNEVAA